ncbi:hypothetical protein Tco_0419220 [Tanacetum coccineum]
MKVERNFTLADSLGFCGCGFDETASTYACGTCVELILGAIYGPFSKKLIWSSSLRSHQSALMVIESEVLNDLPRFFSVLIMEFATGGTVNLTLKMKRDMIIKKLDLNPKINAMMRDFLDLVPTLVDPLDLDVANRDPSPPGRILVLVSLLNIKERKKKTKVSKISQKPTRNGKDKAMSEDGKPKRSKPDQPDTARKESQ